MPKAKPESLQIVSDLDEEFESEIGNDVGLKDLALPDLPREPGYNHNQESEAKKI